MATTAFRPALDLLAQYASDHRDQRNISTHFLGIPLVVFAIGLLLARPSLSLPGGWPLTPADLVWMLSTLWYLTRGNWVLGVATSAANGLLFALAEALAAGSNLAWLGWGLGCFGLGRLIQFLGHYYEGKRPAKTEAWFSLLVGPMFIVGEALFTLGWGRELLGEIERRAGPTHLRDLARPMA